MLLTSQHHSVSKESDKNCVEKKNDLVVNRRVAIHCDSEYTRLDAKHLLNNCSRKNVRP